MPPPIAPPSPEALAELLAANALRFPEKASLDVLGDGGQVVRLPFLLGIPTGSLPPGTVAAFPAWRDFVELVLSIRKDSEGVTPALVRDCILYPARGQLAQWEERWPALVTSLGGVVLQKIGVDHELLAEPGPRDVPPTAIAEQLATSPAAMWRWLKVGDAPIAVAIAPPTPAQWSAFTAALRRPGVDGLELMTELVTTCVKGEGLGARLVQWPGVAVPLENLIAKMAGAAAASRLGLW